MIIGLDPASVGYDFYELSKRLTESDASYVQIIHTDSDKFGFANPLGHGRYSKTLSHCLPTNYQQQKLHYFSGDFYPNGGAAQPGCPLRNRFTNLIGKL